MRVQLHASSKEDCLWWMGNKNLVRSILLGVFLPGGVNKQVCALHINVCKCIPVYVNMCFVVCKSIHIYSSISLFFYYPLQIQSIDGYTRLQITTVFPYERCGVRIVLSFHHFLYNIKPFDWYSYSRISIIVLTRSKYKNSSKEELIQELTDINSSFVSNLNAKLMDLSDKF